MSRGRSSLFRAYLTSLLSLVVSCCMLAGTSVALFSTTLENSGNEIYAGILAVDLLCWDGENWTPLEDSPDFFAGEPLRPGEARTGTYQLINDGDLSVQCAVTLRSGGSGTDGAGYALSGEGFRELASRLTVYTAPGAVDTFPEGDWTAIGTLDRLLEGVELHNTWGLVSGGTEVFSVAIAADSLAASDMGAALDLHMKLVASQSGTDMALVSSGAALRRALERGGDILILEDITVSQPMTVQGDVNLAFSGGSLTFLNEEGSSAFTVTDGASLTISGHGADIHADWGLVRVASGAAAEVTLTGGSYTTWGAMGEGCGLVTMEENASLTLTMQDLTYTGESSGWAVRGDGALDLAVDGCTISAGHGIRTGTSGSVTLKDSSLHTVQGLAVLARSHVSAENCTLDSGYPDLAGEELNPEYFTNVAAVDGGSLELTGCTITGAMNMQALAVLSGGGTITAQGCTLDETAVSPNGGTVTIN